MKKVYIKVCINLKICKKLRCLNEIMMEVQTFFTSSENHSRVFRRCTNSCQGSKFPCRLMYLQFVFPSHVVSGGAGSLSAYVYFPTTRRSESDRRGGGGNRVHGRSRKNPDYQPALATRYCTGKIHIKNTKPFSKTQLCNTDLRAIVHECTAQRVCRKRKKGEKNSV